MSRSLTVVLRGVEMGRGIDRVGAGFFCSDGSKQRVELCRLVLVLVDWLTGWLPGITGMAGSSLHCIALYLAYGTVWENESGYTDRRTDRQTGYRL